MSRCYPFPPPGYEKKARPDDTDLLKKEKQREKKHKKEKKDKEKGEDKEKRDKDRSDGKHRDKKDKQEKHRDKKKPKDKDRDKDKEKASTSGEKRVAGHSESYNGEKLNHKEKNQHEDKSSITYEKKQDIQFQAHNGEKPIRNSLPAEEMDSRFVQELGRRIRDEQKGAGCQLVERFTGADGKKEVRMDRVVAKDTGCIAEGKGKNKDIRVDNKKMVANDTGILVEGKEKNNDIRVDNKKMDGQGIRDKAGFSGSTSTMVHNITGIVQNRIEGMFRPADKNIERRMEGKEKSKEKEVDDKRRDKKDKYMEKKKTLKDTGREKERKKDEKVKEKNEYKFTEQDRFKDSNKNNLIGTHNIKNSHDPMECDKSAAAEGNSKKRKDFGTNGFLHDNDVRPSKMPRPISNPLTENGRKLEPCRTPIMFTSNMQGAASNLCADDKEHKLNGVAGMQPSLSISSVKPLSATTHADQIAKVSKAKASKKPPHPDSMYLSQVLSVPKMEEWFDFDDQEWLFNSNSHSSNPKVGSVGTNETPQVWAKAQHIESADVCALPYVIPY
ncbi:uncharacterized protein LOC132274812 [Cornus florida]|uniref:uncharacterized protein LOC132274812 n=1 Tax=Cornus florida TaxID=4283 RepID=UPI00289CB6A0|nr:uncharacterized protein LOC132274812 [Cornus florida]XP_059632131.1 uncharacterized protein LOC132274812 [Cornus florida]XP_059632132.1 uncharacterized protein LOC132274812 [Cornus florida]